MKHIRKSENHRPYCKLCNISFKNYHNLRHHKRLYHIQREAAGQLPCKTCGKSYITTTLLNQHWNYAHTVQDNLYCNLWRKQFQNMEKLKRHTLMCLTRSPLFLAMEQNNSKTKQVKMTKAETCLEQSRKNENELSCEKDATGFCNETNDLKLVHCKKR